MNTTTYVAMVTAAGISLCVACDKNDKEPSSDPSVERGLEAQQEVGNVPEEGAQPVEDSPALAPGGPAEIAKAETELKAAEGQDIEGEIDFEDTGSGVRVIAKIEDAEPGEHGIHVHEKGDCSDIVGKSMGAHFDPESHDHALPAEGKVRHLGDLGNIQVNQDGDGKLDITIDQANLRDGDPMSLLGKALVIHKGRDSGKSSQPAGDSGTPIACGVIKKT